MFRQGIAARRIWRWGLSWPRTPGSRLQQLLRAVRVPSLYKRRQATRHQGLHGPSPGVSGLQVPRACAREPPQLRPGLNAGHLQGVRAPWPVHVPSDSAHRPSARSKARGDALHVLQLPPRPWGARQVGRREHWLGRKESRLLGRRQGSSSESSSGSSSGVVF